IKTRLTTLTRTNMYSHSPAIALSPLLLGALQALQAYRLTNFHLLHTSGKQDVCFRRVAPRRPRRLVVGVATYFLPALGAKPVEFCNPVLVVFDDDVLVLPLLPLHARLLSTPFSRPLYHRASRPV